MEARIDIKPMKDLSERFTPSVGVASAVLPITNDLATQFALPSKDKLIRTAARTRKQLDVNMPPIPVARNFEIPEIFESFIRYGSGSNDHERIILCGDPEKLSVLEKSSLWLAADFFHLSQSYMRKINELGLKVTYETNHDLALALKMLPSLAFEKKKKDRRFL